MKKVTAKQAAQIANRLNIDVDGDGVTFYAATDTETELFSFDTKKERDAFVERNKSNG